VNLRHIEVFLAVVESESFSGAAEHLFMTQPAVSMQVQAVERHFGAPLLQRRNRRVVLTEAGQAVYKWASQVLRTESETRRVVDELRHAETGRVSVGSTITIGSYILPPILTRFKQQHPGADLVTKTVERDELVSDVMAGVLDCAVLIARQLPPGLTVEVLGTEEMIFICSPDHPLAKRKRVCASDLADQPFIIAPRNSSYRRIVDDVLATQGLQDVSVLMELDAGEGAKRSVREGLGIGVALRSGVDWEVAHGYLREIKLPGPPARVEIGLISRPRQSTSPMARVLMDYLREHVGAHLQRAHDEGASTEP
jgi:LysR family transcriptional regulator, low CO2-responsive transcriptional regulator